MTVFSALRLRIFPALLFMLMCLSLWVLSPVQAYALPTNALSGTDLQGQQNELLLQIVAAKRHTGNVFHIQTVLLFTYSGGSAEPLSLCGTGTQYSPLAVAQFLYKAGFRGQDLVTMVAIAGGESAWNSAACNLHDPYGGSFGLFQINGSHFLSGATTKRCAFDPQCSANFAYQLYSANKAAGGSGFSDWGAYTNRSYLRYLAAAQRAVASMS